MAKITFTADDGSMQDFEVVIPAVDPVVEVDTKTESGAEESFVPETPAVEPTAPTATA